MEFRTWFRTWFGASRLALGLALLLGFATDAGAKDVYGPNAILRWSPSHGPVSAYAVYLDRNGQGFSPVPDFMTPAPVAFVSGAPGDTLRVRVAAYSLGLGEISAYSSVSSTFRFVPYQPPETEPSLVENGSFEKNGWWQPHLTLWANQVLGGWKVLAHSVDWLKGPASEGGRSVDLNGQWAGGLSQEIETEPGRYYFAYFSLGANPTCRPWVKTFLASAAGQERYLDIDSSGRSQWNYGWFRPDPLVFRADSALTTLELRSDREGGNGACGPIVDDVVVRAAP